MRKRVCQEFWTQPQAAFSRLRQDGDLVSPILFGLIVGFVGGLLDQIWSLMFGGSLALLSGLANDLPLEHLAGMGGAGIVGVVMFLVVFPFAYLFVLFIASGIYHLVLNLLGGLQQSEAGFEGSLKVVAYSAPAGLAAIIPFVGGIIGMIWALVLYIIGLATVHKTTHAKAVLAVLIPIVLCCICAVLVAMAFGFGIAGMAAAANG